MRDAGINSFKKLTIWADEQRRLPYYNPDPITELDPLPGRAREILAERKADLEKLVGKISDNIQDKIAGLQEVSDTDSDAETDRDPEL